jgi:hypothetical protein
MARTGTGKTTPTTTAVVPTAITIDVRQYATLTLLPVEIQAQIAALTAEANNLKAITSTGAIEIGDALASRMKALEVEVDTTVKAQLEAIEAALKAVKDKVGELRKPLGEARVSLCERVVKAKLELDYDGPATSCYSQERETIVVDNISKVPATMTWTDKGGEKHTEKVLVVDTAAVGRLQKAGVFVPGVHVEAATTYVTRSPK